MRTEATAARLRSEWGIAVDTDPRAFFAAELDAVIVASPNHLHAEHAILAHEAGAHVLVEKPMAITLADCDAMLRAARSAGRVLAVGHEMRVFQLFEAVRREAAALGRPRHLDLRLFRRPYRSGASGWKQDPRKLGSSILEEPIHYLDLARWYLGEPRTLQAWAVSRQGAEASFEDLDIRLGFDDGASALVTRSIAAFEHHVSLDMTLEGGALRAHWNGRSDMEEEPGVGLAVGSADGIRIVEVPRRTGHAFDVPRQTRAFLDAVAGRGDVPADGEDGRAAVALCLAAERSILQGSVELAVG